MVTYALPALFVVLLWWFSTGAVLWLARGREETVPARLLAMTALAALGFAGAMVAANSAAPWAPYAGFVAAILIWGWAEFTFLTGLITGPRTSVCPRNVTEPQRFRLAFRTVSRHEFALVAALFGIGLITHGGADQTAFWTFATLWVMRISAKLTIFSGVPFFARDMMPPPISHMQSYFRHDRIGPVFWASVTLLTLLLSAALAAFAWGAIPRSGHTTAVMLTALIGLAAFEHWVMILPVRETALWQWAMNEKPEGPALSATKLQVTDG